MQNKPTLAVLGGTGALGTGMVKRWAKAGYPVIIGSRSADKAAEAARGHVAAAGAPAVRGADTLSAAREADIVVVAVPFSSHAETLAEIRDVVQGKIVIDAVVPLVPPKVAVVQMPPEGSASMIAQSILGDAVRVVAAFHNVGAAKLASDGPVECDVLICGNDKEAREATVALTRDAGLRGVEAGPLPNSVAVEALTSILIGINRRYKVDCAGIRITGLDATDAA
jgi:NADPH-dependent F420 reductase